MKHLVSGYIMAWNEFPNVRAAIFNILQYVDELIVLDGGSTDGSLECYEKIARGDSRLKYAVWMQEGTFYGQGWQHGERRNWCINACQHDWILTIDADELVGDTDKDYFREQESDLLMNTINLINRQEMIVECRKCHPAQWWPDPHVRFHRKAGHKWPDNEQHQRVNVDGHIADTTAIQSEVPIWHYHGVIKANRCWDNEEDRKQLTLRSIPCNEPRFAELMKGKVRS